MWTTGRQSRKGHEVKRQRRISPVFYKASCFCEVKGREGKEMFWLERRRPKKTKADDSFLPEIRERRYVYVSAFVVPNSFRVIVLVVQNADDRIRVSRKESIRVIRSLASVLETPVLLCLCHIYCLACYQSEVSKALTISYLLIARVLPGLYEINVLCVVRY